MTIARRQKAVEPIKWHRAVATAISILVIIYGGYAIWRNAFDPPGVDFVSFWAAGRLALDGHPELAYNIGAHRNVELTSGHVGGLMPFPYPPPFLFVVIPFALAPFVAAFTLWLVATAVFYVFAVRKHIPPKYSLAIPAALPNTLIGQNGFLTTGIMVVGLSNLSSRPWLAGAILGLMVIKPQLALLLPVALLAGREWRAIGGATASAFSALCAAAVVFGFSTYRGFFSILPQYAEFLHESRLPWDELASTFAGLRYLGIGEQSALVMHGVIALGAIIYTWQAWSRGWECRAEVLAAGTVLMPPYLFTYDSLLLALPIGWLVQAGRNMEAAIVWILCLVPIAGLADFYSGPNTTPLAAICSLLFLRRGLMPAHDDDRSHSPALTSRDTATTALR